MKKRISVYVKGDRNSASYYRIYQYIDNVSDVKKIYHLMCSPYLHNRFFPISIQPLIIKIIIYLNMFGRMLWALIEDTISRPDVIIVHRRILVHYMPSFFFGFLRLMIYRGSRLVWDYDDNILEAKEISKKNFETMACLSSVIVVTHENLSSLVSKQYKHKIRILPTTDGDMYKSYISHQKEITQFRINSLHSEISLVWVATSSNMKYLEHITPILDEVGKNLEETQNRQLTLHVICDKPLLQKTKYLKVMNIKWSRKAAINGMLSSSIGIMPLEDNTFTRGKGGFKLVQYQSVGLPCIGSAVGFNCEVIQKGSGYAVNNTYEDWNTAIQRISNVEHYIDYSIESYKNWWVNFNYESNLIFWKSLILE